MRQLRQLLSQQDENISLDLATLELAAIEFPDLDAGPFLEILDSHARELGGLVSPDAPGEEFVAAANRYLFETLGFRGNEENYYDPKNSCLNEVLTARTGIPVSLGVVYIEIARRLGRPVHGIEFPAHFLVQYKDDGYMAFIDCFYGGRVLSFEQLREMGREAAKIDVYTIPEILKPAPARRILIRMLLNLRAIYLKAEQHAKALAVVELLIEAKPGDAEGYRDRGALLGYMGRVQASLADLTKYLNMAPNAGDREAIEKHVAMLRQYLRSMN